MDRLPKEIIDIIYGFLSYKYKFRLGKTNKKYFNILLNHESYEVFKFKRDFDKTNEYIKIVNKWRNFNFEIDLYGSYITDVSALGNVHTLDLSETKVKDVSALGNVHTLNLYWCQNITDVSALGNVHTLDLSGCKYITDVSALGNVHTLDLSNTNITDVSTLGNVHTLNLYWCKNIKDISALNNVHTLNLYKY